MSALEKILVVEDEPNIAEVVRLYLEHAGYEPLLLAEGKEVEATVQLYEPALVLLDVMLPDVDGFELCRNMRAMPGDVSHTPIILLTAKGEPIDKLRGFNLGVDDYIVKPFDPNELIARIKAVLRRTRSKAAAEGAPAEEAEARKTAGRRRVLQFGGLTIDPVQFKVSVGGSRVDLTLKEIELLYCLAENPGRVYSRDDLLRQVWHFDFSGGTRTVDAHVKNLRKKLGADPAWSIQTMWGIGYSFEVNEDA